MLKIWIEGLAAYLVLVYVTLYALEPGAKNLLVQYVYLLPLFAFYVFSLKVEPLNGNNPHVVNSAYALALTFASWLTFWFASMAFLIVSCTFFTTCDL